MGMIKLLVAAFFSSLATTIFSQVTFLKHYGDFSGRGNSLIINAEGNYVVGGVKSQSPNSDQFCRYEINPQGDTLELNYFGSTALEYASQIIQTADAGYAIIGTAGYMSSAASIFLVKTTPSGNIAWSKNYGGTGFENGTCIIQESTGGFLIGGRSKDYSNGLFDFYLIKTDINGDTIWSKNYGGGDNDEITSMRQTLDGGFILSGNSNSFSNGLKDFYLIKINAAGDTTWTKHYGDSLNQSSNSVRQTTDGGYIMVGASYDNLHINMYVVKTNSDGDTLWTKKYEEAGRNSEGNDIIQTADGGFALTGRMDASGPNAGNGLFIVKMNSIGALQWKREYRMETNNSSGSSEGYSIVETADGGFAVTGNWFNGSTFELLLLKTGNDGTVDIDKIINTANFNLFPHPITQQSTLQFENPKKERHTLNVFDSEGKQQLTIMNIVSDRVEILKGSFAKGTYFFQLTKDDKTVASGKMLIE